MNSAQAPASTVTVTDDGTTAVSVELSLEQELHVKLRANPTTGYTWHCDADNAGGIRLVSRKFQPNAAGSTREFGSGGIELFAFKAQAVGSQRLQFEYRRGPSGQSARSYEVCVTVGP